jgi:hypothetical protein
MSAAAMSSAKHKKSGGTSMDRGQRVTNRQGLNINRHRMPPIWDVLTSHDKAVKHLNAAADDAGERCGQNSEQIGELAAIVSGIQKQVDAVKQKSDCTKAMEDRVDELVLAVEKLETRLKTISLKPVTKGGGKASKN